MNITLDLARVMTDIMSVTRIDLILNVITRKGNILDGSTRVHTPEYNLAKYHYNPAILEMFDYVLNLV